MKPAPISPPERAVILAFGAHPDDIEFGCGGVIALETRAGRSAHGVVVSRGESATNGSPEQRMAEGARGMELLGATFELVELDGDGRLQSSPSHALRLAALIRRLRPEVLLAPTPAANQHPDHAALGRIVRDAARLARFGGVAELRGQPPHAIGALLFYALTPDAEPRGEMPLLIDVSEPAVLAAWTAAMQAHASQAATRDYVGLQLNRARVNGQRGGVSHAIPLFANDPPLLDSLRPLAHAARHF